MNFAELCTEVHDMGFHSVPRTRVERWVNQAYLEVCDHRHWPFLEAEITGVHPLTISDLRAVQSVNDDTSGEPLYHEYRDKLIDMGKSIGQTGQPTVYFIEGGNTILVWLKNVTNTLRVRYWKVPAELTGTDTPVVPARYHDLIVMGATRRAYHDAGDPDRAAAVEEQRQAGLAQMATAYGQSDKQPDQGQGTTT